MKRPPPTPRETIATVRAVYAELAARPIERACDRRGDCCHFRLTGRTPFLTKGEAIVAAAALRASGRNKLPVRADGACPMLAADASGCAIYEGRPFGCRTHFCAAAGGPYARGEVIDLIHRLEDLDTALGGDGARLLPGAIQSALSERGR